MARKKKVVWSGGSLEEAKSVTRSVGRPKKNITMEVTVEREDLVPVRGSPYSAGYDLVSNEDVWVGKRNTVIAVGTGVKMAIPDRYVGMVCPRSGLALKYGVSVANAPGIIDPDYRGEIKVLLYSITGKRMLLPAGTRIAQIVFVPFVGVDFDIKESLPQTERGEGGFGSTGIVVEETGESETKEDE